MASENNHHLFSHNSAIWEGHNWIAPLLPMMSTGVRHVVSFSWKFGWGWHVQDGFTHMSSTSSWGAEMAGASLSSCNCSAFCGPAQASLPNDWIPRGRKRKLQVLLKLGFESPRTSLLLYSLGQSKSQVQPDPRKRKETLLLNGKSGCDGRTY